MKKPKLIIYPKIKEWLLHERLTMQALSEKCGLPYITLYKVLTGLSVPRKDTIDNILAATGMTYEEAFQEVAE